MPSLNAKPISSAPTSFDWTDPRRSSSTTTLMLARQELQRKKRLEGIKPTIGGQYGGSITKGRKQQPKSTKPPSRLTLKSIVRKTTPPLAAAADKYGPTKVKKPRSSAQKRTTTNQEASDEKPTSSSSSRSSSRRQKSRSSLSSKESKRKKHVKKKVSSKKNRVSSSSSRRSTPPNQEFTDIGSIEPSENDAAGSALDFLDADIFPTAPQEEEAPRQEEAVPECNEDDYLEDEFEEEDQNNDNELVQRTSAMDLTVPEYNHEDGIVSVESSFRDDYSMDDTDAMEVKILKRKRILQLNSELAATAAAKPKEVPSKFPYLELYEKKETCSSSSMKSPYIRKASLKQLKKPSAQVLESVVNHDDDQRKEEVKKRVTERARSELRNLKSRHSLTDLRSEHEEALAMLKEIDESSPRLGLNLDNEDLPVLKSKEEPKATSHQLVSAALLAADSELDKSMSTYKYGVKGEDELNDKEESAIIS